MRNLIVLLLALICSSVWAAPVTWTLSDVFFTGGDALTGSFDYDADTNTYSDINIFFEYDDPFEDGYHNFYTTTGVWHNGDSFESDSNGAYFYPWYDFPEHFDFLALWFTAPLTNSGGNISLESGSGIFNQYIYYGGTVTPVLTGIASGSVTANTVPIPAAVWLFGSALAGLGFLRRRIDAP
jgi:hypothetical protein